MKKLLIALAAGLFAVSSYARICHERCTPKEKAAIARLRIALIKLGYVPVIPN
ncbi:MAG TPA: hypothetical protein VN957_20340 [Chthoniobacterales bacterium]|nr:hypothetical protein [Chthoniobacterales bacterium]